MDHDAVTLPMLLMSYASGQSEPVDVTSEHEELPSARRPPASPLGLVGLLPERQPPPRARCSGAGDGPLRRARRGSPRTGTAPSPPGPSAPYLPRHPAGLRSLWPGAHCITLCRTATPVKVSAICGPGHLVVPRLWSRAGEGYVSDNNERHQ